MTPNLKTIKLQYLDNSNIYITMTTKTRQNSADILKKYIDASLADNKSISFFILNGLQGIGKSKVAQDLSKELLWQYFANDFLHIKDFSTQLKKTHSIKVQKKEDETYKTLFKEYNYQDLGTREINSWLLQSPAGSAKIILIENIERMTIGAINAFLKTCEEPLQNRIIIATTANKSQIIDTIISRAIIIPFHVQDYISKYDFKDDLVAVTKILATDTNIHKKHALLSTINKKWLIKPFLDELIAYYILQNDFQNSKKRLNVKKMSQTNVNMDNMLFYGLLD